LYFEVQIADIGPQIKRVVESKEQVRCEHSAIWKLTFQHFAQIKSKEWMNTAMLVNRGLK